MHTFKKLIIFDFEIVTDSDIRGGRGVSKSDKKWHRGGEGGKNSIFIVTSLMNGPYTIDPIFIYMCIEYAKVDDFPYYDFFLFAAPSII